MPEMLPAKIPDYSHQKKLVRAWLKILEEKMMAELRDGLLVVMDIAQSIGVEPEVVASEIDDYKNQLPDWIKKIELVVAFDSLPQRENMH